MERLASYQREKPVNPIHLQRHAQKPLNEKEEHFLSEWDMWRIKDALSTMTQLERDVFMMKVGQGFSFGEIVAKLDVSKESILLFLMAERECEHACTE